MSSPFSSPPSSPALPSSDLLTRREAIARTAALLGIALTPALLSGVLHAQTAPAARSANGAPGAGGARHLTAAQFTTLGAACERILPRTDTPGAIDVGVPAFIDFFFGEFMTPAERTTFTAGLAELETASTTAHQKNFAALAVPQQDALLQRIAEASQAKEKTFFHLLRELTLLAYFTSERVGKNVTHYDPVPGVWRACVPISEVGNVAWTR